MPGVTTEQPQLVFQGITKRFPGVTALADVSFSIRLGECHALCGENGAGKSTLGKILAGVHPADAGRVVIAGEEVAFADPFAAGRFGVSMVHQELLFCPNLSVAENIFLGAFPARHGFVDRAALRERARAILHDIGIGLDPDRLVEKLSIAEKQLAQIAAGVARGARIIVMDEPTSSISQADTEHLFTLIRLLKSRGVTIIYVSHRMDEIFTITDRISILRDGRFVTTLETAKTSRDEVVRHMVGRTIEAYFPAYAARPLGDEVLSVRHLTVPGQFTDISLALRAGEILGLAGLVGAGRSELAQAVFGLAPQVSGEIRVAGVPAVIRSPRAAMSLGIGLVPEDRKLQGLVLEMSAAENMTLTLLDRLVKGCFIDRGACGRLVEGFFARLGIRPNRPLAPSATYSGGNQQKVVLAKWLARDCRVLIIDEPTRGIDVGAKAEFYRLIVELAQQGKGILLISSELPELLGLCDRILVLRGGRSRGELPRAEATQEKLMQRMAGVEEKTA